MPTATPAVKRLLEAVQKLSPAEYAEFTLRLGEWEESADAPSEAVLIQRTSFDCSSIRNSGEAAAACSRGRSPRNRRSRKPEAAKRRQ